MYLYIKVVILLILANVAICRMYPSRIHLGLQESVDKINEGGNVTLVCTTHVNDRHRWCRRDQLTWSWRPLDSNIIYHAIDYKQLKIVHEEDKFLRWFQLKQSKIKMTNVRSHMSGEFYCELYRCPELGRARLTYGI